MNLHQDDYPSWVDSFIEDTATMECLSLSSDEEIWNLMTEYPPVPHVGNIYCSILLGEICTQLSKKYENHSFECDINAIATTFNVNGENVSSHEEMMRAIRAEEPLSLSEFAESSLGKKQLYVQYVEYISDLDLDMDTDELLVREHSKLFKK